jgi:hypothetical protein
MVPIKSGGENGKQPPANQVKLKQDCAVSMACIVGFPSARLRRSKTMARLSMARNDSDAKSASSFDREVKVIHANRELKA